MRWFVIRDIRSIHFHFCVGCCLPGAAGPDGRPGRNGAPGRPGMNMIFE